MMQASEKDLSANSELIAFRLGGQEFCVDIMSVRDIRGWTQTTPLPHSPDYVKGVINLRGSVLPVIDLAARLGFTATEPTARHVIVVTQVNKWLAKGITTVADPIGDWIGQDTKDVALALPTALGLALGIVVVVFLRGKGMAGKGMAGKGGGGKAKLAHAALACALLLPMVIGGLGATIRDVVQ